MLEEKEFCLKRRNQDSNLGLLPEADALPLSYRGLSFQNSLFLEMCCFKNKTWKTWSNERNKNKNIIF